MAETRQMSVVKKPTDPEVSVIAPTTGLAIKGDGPLNFVCGGCRSLLVEGVEQGQISGLVIRCPKCKAHNETLD